MEDFLKGRDDGAIKALALRAGADGGAAATREGALNAIADALAKKLGGLTVGQLREKGSAWGAEVGKGKKKALVDAIINCESGFNGALSEFYPTENAGGGGPAAPSEGSSAEPPKGEPAPTSDSEPFGKLEGEIKEIGRDIERTVAEAEAAGLLFDEEVAAITRQLAERAGKPSGLRGVDEMAGQALGRLGQGDMDGGMAALADVVGQADRALADFESMVMARALLAAKDTIECCRMAEANNPETERMLHDALRGERDSVPGARERAVALLAKCVIIYREELVALQSVLQTKQIFIANMKAQGVDVFNAERFLRRASDALAVRSCREAGEYLAKAERSAVESRSAWIEQVRGYLPQVEATVREAKALGADVAEAEQLLEKARFALDGGNYTLCAELVKRGERRAMESQQAQVHKAEELRRRQLQAAQESLASISMMAVEARAYNIEGWQRLESKITETQEALARYDAFGATTSSKDASEIARQMSQAIEEGRKGVDAMQVQLTGPCPRCNVMAVKVLQTGYGRCVSCGYVYPFQFQQQAPKQEKKGFGIFKR